MKQGHIESGGEQYHLDQVKQMKRGILLKNFSTFDESTGIYHCRFQPNCSKTYQRREMMSLSAHLLIHVRDSTERSVKNPKFYENLIFHSVPIDKQFDVGNAFNENGEKLDPASRSDNAAIDTKIPWFFQQLKLTKRRPSAPPHLDPAQQSSKRPVHCDEATVSEATQQQHSDYGDVYREWKRYCFLARKNVRSEAIENSMKERRLLPTPINQPIATAEPQPRHSRFSIFNRVTNQMQQSVIKLNPAKPVPTSVRRLNFTTELSPVKVQPTVRDDDETGDTVETVKTQLTKKLSRPSVICPNPAVPNIMDIEHDESNSDDDAEIDLNQLKRTFHAVKNAFYNQHITTKRPRISHIESKTYSIPKKLQAVNNTESIFTIQATFSTFGTRGKTKRMLDLVGPAHTLVDDETQIQMAIRRSLEESTGGSSETVTGVKSGKKRGSGAIRRTPKTQQQMHQMGKVTS